MKIFITGASGWIGSAVTDELLGHGYEVVGLARSDASAAKLAARGAEVHRGSLDDPSSLAAGAKGTDGVIHLAMNHDFTDPAAAGRAEHAAVSAMLAAIEGTGKPFLIASGVAGLAQGRPATEDDPSPFRGADSMRGGSENLALDHADKGVRPVALRFAASVHGAHDHGFVAVLTGIAKERGVAAYIGDGSHAWPAVHVADAARAVRLALEKAPAGSRMHVVAEEGIPTREIAEAIGADLGVPTASIAPEEAPAHFGWMARFFGMGISATAGQTRSILGWAPNGPTLLEDIAAGAYDLA